MPLIQIGILSFMTPFFLFSMTEDRSEKGKTRNGEDLNILILIHRVAFNGGSHRFHVVAHGVPPVSNGKENGGEGRKDESRGYISSGRVGRICVASPLVASGHRGPQTAAPPAIPNLLPLFDQTPRALGSAVVRNRGRRRHDSFDDRIDLYCIVGPVGSI